jgi:mono/diheme cytochrome c family protein
MQNKFAVLIIAGFTVLGVAVSAAVAVAPAPAEPPTFFSTLAPADNTSSQAAATAVPTEAPTAQPTVQPTAAIARPSNPGGAGPAAALKGNAAAGQVVFDTSCVKCHGQEGKGGVANPGSDDGTVPALNPIDETLASQDSSTFASNLDLFLEHGSMPSGASPTFSMPNWGDSSKLKAQQIADVIAYVISLNPAASASPAQIARPSNPGGTGPAAALKGNAAAGQVVFEANCVKCHGQEGKGSIANPGSDDGTVPALNPIDETLAAQDYSTFAGNLDLFLEHGSTPSGPSPVFSMPNWGDSGKLTHQQLADVIAYVISLNK